MKFFKYLYIKKTTGLALSWINYFLLNFKLKNKVNIVIINIVIWFSTTQVSLLPKDKEEGEWGEEGDEEKREMSKRGRQRQKEEGEEEEDGGGEEEEEEDE